MRLLDGGHLPGYTAYAIGEILLVVIGILIALQINNLNEERKESALATTYVENLRLLEFIRYSATSDLSRNFDERLQVLKHRLSIGIQVGV